MITEDKVTELFCLADEFCKFFDRMVAKYCFKGIVKRFYHRNSAMSKADYAYHGIKLHLISNGKKELLNFMITPGDIDDWVSLKYEAFIETVYGKLIVLDLPNSPYFYKV